MVAQLSDKLIIKRELLKVVAETRVADAASLFDAGRYAAAVYLAGYAVECSLKAMICKTLDLDDLPGTFAVHDLELLLLHSGLNKRIRENSQVHEAFKKLDEVWSEVVRYDDPVKYTTQEAGRMMTLVREVVQWLVPMIS